MMSTFIERKVTKFSSNNSYITHKKVYSDNLLWYYSLFLCYFARHFVVICFCDECFVRVWRGD